MKKKAALYIRVSTEAQADEGYSIQAQTEKLEAFCKMKELSRYELYVDGGQSGSNLNRPRMQDLICDGQKGEISHVIVYKLDRLSRSQRDTLYLIEEVFLPNQIDFISINENIDTSSPYGRAMIGIMSAFAQLERENIFLRTRMGMVERIKNGYWMGGGRVPFGYDYNSQLGIIVPNEDAIKVKRIYDLYIAGYSSGKIAMMLGLKYERLVTQILIRKSNTGVIVYKGQEYEGLHQAIVSPETYHLAMQKMKERSTVRTTNNYHLLTGLCYCGECGARMRYQKWGRKGYKLVCYSRDRNKPHMVKDPNCENQPEWAENVEDIVKADLFGMTAALAGNGSQDRQEPLDPVSMLEDRKQILSSKIKRLYNLYAENGNDLLLSTIEEIQKDLDDANKQLETEMEHRVLTQNLLEVQERVINIQDTWPYMTAKERQTVIRDCVEKIVIQNGGIDIFYTFIEHEEKSDKSIA